MRSNNKRHEILDAALRVVEARGANHLTIDAVAAESGISKGGVLYHFASKKALLSGMLDYMIDSISARNQQEGDATHLLRLGNTMTPAEQRASLALLAAAAEDSELLQPAKSFIGNTLDQLREEASCPDEAITLFLANEGLRFLDILDLNPMTAKQKKDIHQHLSDRAEGI